MNVGFWGAPAVLAGLVMVLWVASWLERLVERPTFDVELVADPGPGTGSHG